MSSLLLIMLLSLSLTTSFCEGRSASFLHSRKDTAKMKVKKPSSVSSMSEAMTEQTDRVTTIRVKSISDHMSSDHRKEDNIRRENSSSYVHQKPDFVAVSLRKPPHSASEEKPVFDLDYAMPRIHPPSHN